MNRPPLEVADLVRVAGQAFIERNRKWISWKHVKVLLAIQRCHTAVLGGHLDECTRCGHRAISYNSCRNRHCPKCQAGARDRWLEKRRRELLPTPYVHVVFTLPRPLAPLLCRTKRSSTISCSEPVRKRSSKSLAIPDISAQRSVSSACCTPGIRNSNCTRMCIVLSRMVGCLPIGCTGSRPATPSFFPFRCLVASFAASSLRHSSAPSRTASSTFMET